MVQAVEQYEAVSSCEVRKESTVTNWSDGLHRQRLPESLQEYVLVWCADLLRSLSEAQRQALLNAVTMSYEGGPWPRRLRIQRLAEQSAGIVTDDAILGEITATYGHGVNGIIEAMSDPEFPASR